MQKLFSFQVSRHFSLFAACLQVKAVLLHGVTMGTKGPSLPQYAHDQCYLITPRDYGTMPAQGWPTVLDAGPTRPQLLAAGNGLALSADKANNRVNNLLIDMA